MSPGEVEAAGGEDGARRPGRDAGGAATSAPDRPRLRAHLVMLLTLLFVGLLMAFLALSYAALGRGGAAWIAALGGAGVAGLSVWALERTGHGR